MRHLKTSARSTMDAGWNPNNMRNCLRGEGGRGAPCDRHVLPLASAGLSAAGAPVAFRR